MKICLSSRRSQAPVFVSVDLSAIKFKHFSVAVHLDFFFPFLKNLVLSA